MIKYSDSPKSEEKWKRLEEVTSPEFVSAMKELYSLYDFELVEWFANLYDPTVGGWYYSISARDNDRIGETNWLLRPDLESTMQALGFVSRSGMTGGKGYADFLPEWMKRDIGDYVYNSQDEDGYFYHAHWGKKIPIPRRGRDFNWSRYMLSALGREMKYKTILDKPKEEKKEDKGEDKTLIPDHLKSKEAFIEYLDSLDVNNKSYPAGHQLGTQAAQIKSQGLEEVCIEYLNARQHPETGIWHNETNYYGINGLMKITGVYSDFGRAVPNARTAALSAIKALVSDEPIVGIVDIWNTWVAVRFIIDSIRANGGEGAEELCEDILKEVRAAAVEGLIKTKEKILPFKKPDHAFSYCRECPASQSQGMPVCIPGLPEGDVNATVMAVTLMVENIFISLGLIDYLVPIYGEDEAKRFLEIIEENRKKVK